MIKKQRSLILIICLLCLSVAVSGLSLAWLGLDQNTIVTHISGRLVSEYFHCGSGSEADPFVITRPIHYYHMVEFFQRLTNLPVVVYDGDNVIVKFGTDYLYFQIGCPEEQLYNPELRPETDENTEYFVFDYDSIGTLNTEFVDGQPRGKKSKSLNMAYYGGELALMPIGSSAIPFVGQLDGKGLTIANLNVTTTSTVYVYQYDENGSVVSGPETVDRSTCDVGIFGYVASTGVPHGETEAVETSIKDLYFDGLTIDLSGLDAGAITSIVDGQPHRNTADIHNDTVCYAGYIAGHITLSSLVDNVYINNATFRGGSAATVGYGYFGCVEDENGEPITTLGSEVSKMRTEGDDAGFGGSLDMNEMFNRLNTLYSNPATTVRNVVSEELWIDEVAETEEIKNQATANAVARLTANQAGSAADIHYYSSTLDGSYYMFRRSSNGNWTALYLYGENTVPNTKTVTTYTLLKDEQTGTYQKVTGIQIHDGAAYLIKSGNTTVGSGAANGASVWFLDGDGHLYTRDATYVDDSGNQYMEAGATQYYLNTSSRGVLSVSQNADTVWTYDAQANTITSEIDDSTWYLRYDNGWSLYPYTDTITISNGAAYLGNRTNATLAGNATNAAHWVMDNGHLTAFINNRFYYLNASGGDLTIDTTPTTTWTDTDGVLTYTDGNDRTWYLVYDGGWACVPFTDSFTISHGAYYLGYNGSAANAAAAGSALHFSQEGGSLATVYNGDLRYLSVSGGELTLTAGSSNVSWTVSGDTVSYTDGNGTTWYLGYDSGWYLFPAQTIYRIHSGNNYFGANGTDLTSTNQAGSAIWGISGNKIFTAVNGTVYYLSASDNGAVSLTTNSAAATEFTYTAGGGTMTYSAGGKTWYLYREGGNWVAYPSENIELISQNGTYLGAASASSVGTAASAWTIDGEGNIYTYYDGADRYLTSSGGSVILAASPSTVWTQNQDGTITDENGWYLIGDNGWTVSPELSYVLINDGGSNYLNRNGSSGVINETAEANASKWFADGNKLYNLSGATRYYLTATSSTLSVTANAGDGTEFTYDGTNNVLSFELNDTTYYVVFDGEWGVSDSLDAPGPLSNSNSTRFLNATTSAVSTGTSSTTNWKFDSNTGKLFCVINGTRYYLRGQLEARQTRSATNLTVTTDSTASGTTWTYSGGYFSCDVTVDNAQVEYFLVLENNTWKLMDTSKHYYTLQNAGNSNYLNTNSNANPSPAGGTDNTTATMWHFSNETLQNNATFQLTTVINGRTYYLHMSTSNNGNATLATSTETLKWYVGNNNYIQRNGGSYDLGYNNGWKSINSSNNSYRMTRTQITFNKTAATIATGTYVTVEEAKDLDATITVTPETALTDVAFVETSGNASHTINAVSEAVEQTVTPISESLTVSTPDADTRFVSVTSESGLPTGYPTYFPLRRAVSGDSDYAANDLYKVSMKNTGYIVGGGNFYDGNTDGAKYGDIRISEYAIGNISNSYSQTGLSGTTIHNGNNYLYLTDSDGDGVYDTISNTTDSTKANFWMYEGNKLYTIIGKKTYYLTYDDGLALSTSTGVNWTYGNNRLYHTSGNTNHYIRYNNGWTATNNTNNTATLQTGQFTTVYTYDGTHHAYTENTDIYTKSRRQLLRVLNGASNVYGLHFMNAEISKDRLVTADYVSIFGQEYHDYEMPEDSIDFNVIERGTINFFAGTWFTGNNAFFSLHKIFRYKADDQDVIDGLKKVDDIKDIKEIIEVYAYETAADKHNYIYKFDDDTYSDEDLGYTGATSLADGYNSEPVFKTSWITDPGSLTTRRVYYFEIPANEGEYCLGSVAGKTGAYLIYLDIATRGGDTIATAISSEGNEIVHSFKVEVRETPDTVDHTVLQFAIDAPEVASADDFSTTVSFDKTETASPHTSGLYTLSIVNKSGTDATIDVYLCDDDFNLFTAFPYAYRVRYKNSDHDDWTYIEPSYGDSFQMMASFVIVSTGTAYEASYQ